MNNNHFNVCFLFVFFRSSVAYVNFKKITAAIVSRSSEISDKDATIPETATGRSEGASKGYASGS